MPICLTSTTVPSAKVATLSATNMPNGSWIQLHTVSLGVAATEIVFNNTYITTAYDDYVMIGKQVIPATDGAEAYITTSTDNGVSNVTTNGVGIFFQYLEVVDTVTKLQLVLTLFK